MTGHLMVCFKLLIKFPRSAAKHTCVKNRPQFPSLLCKEFKWPSMLFWRAAKERVCEITAKAASLRTVCMQAKFSFTCCRSRRRSPAHLHCLGRMLWEKEYRKESMKGNAPHMANFLGLCAGIQRHSTCRQKLSSGVFNMGRRHQEGLWQLQLACSSELGLS